MNIEWTNCSERMPPDNDSEILIRRVMDDRSILAHKGELISTPANEIWFDIDKNKLNHWEWTPFTQKKLEFLNK